MDDIGVGLVGYGLGGRAFHAPYIAITPGMTLRAVVSSDADKVHRDWPDVAVVPDLDRLLVVDGIDLVVVSSPDAFHAEQAIAALARGKHVVVDKPFATNLADARRMAAAAVASGTVLTAFHNRRWDADFLTLRRIVSEQRLGRIVEIESRFDRWRPVAAAVWKEAREGGSWLDLGPHLVDQMLQLLGRPQAVFADIATLRDEAAAPDFFRVLLRYPGCRVALHSSKVAAANRRRFVVHGTQGSWIKDGIDPQEQATAGGRAPGGSDWGVDPEDGLVYNGDPHSRPVPLLNDRGDYRCFWSALAAALRGNGPNPVPPQQAIEVIEILDAGLRSAAERREITLP